MDMCSTDTHRGRRSLRSRRHAVRSRTGGASGVDAVCTDRTAPSQLGPSMRSSRRTRGYSRSCTSTCCRAREASTTPGRSGSGGCSPRWRASEDDESRAPNGGRVSRGLPRGEAAGRGRARRSRRAQAARPHRHRVEQPARRAAGQDHGSAGSIATSTRWSCRRRRCRQARPGNFHARARGSCVSRPSDAVMVGDSWAADIEGARAAGIRADLVQPLAVVRRPPDRATCARSATLSPMDDIMRAIFDADVPSDRRGRRSGAHRHRSRRDEDRSDRARRRWPRAVSPARADAARRLRGDRRSRRVARRAGRGRRRHARPSASACPASCRRPPASSRTPTRPG